MKKLLLSLVIFTSLNAVADPQIQSTFVPVGTKENAPDFIKNDTRLGVYGEGQDGSWICYGEVTIEKERNLFEPGLGMYCKGEKLTLKDMVSKKMEGIYLGSNILYKEPAMRQNRSGWTHSPKHMSGVMVYWIKQ